MGKRDRQTKRRKQSSLSQSQEPVQQDNQELNQQENIDIKVSLQQKILEIKNQTKPAFIALSSIVQQQQKLDQQRQKQIEAIIEKYRILSIPLIKKTSQVVQGTNTDKSLIQKSVFLSQSEISKGISGIKIPQYWYNVILNTDLCDFITQQDHDALKNLTNLDIEFDSQKSTLSIQMSFNENKLFKNKTLKVTLQQKHQDQVFKNVQQINFNGKIQQDSFFNLFDKNQESQNAIYYSIYKRFYYQVIPYSIYYYFGLKSQQDDDAFDNYDEEDLANLDEGQDDESQQKVQRKPSKKAKLQSTKPQRTNTQTEKPQCNKQ